MSRAAGGEAVRTFDPVMLGMGCIGVYDYAHDGTTFNDRLSHCYRLAAQAFYDVVELPKDAPVPFALVHGSWHGPQAPNRIDHAWVLLSNRRDTLIWEPITKAICRVSDFNSYTRARSHDIYDAVSARRNLMRHGHFGPWH